LSDLESAFSQPLGYQPAERSLVVNDQQVRDRTPGMQGANILTQPKPIDQPVAADTAIEALRRAKWLAVTN
jgi:hypothetical protein